MSDRNFWDSLMGQVEDGASRLIQNEIDARVNPPQSVQAAPDTSYSVYERLSAEMNQNKMLFLGIGLVVLIFVVIGGRRGKR